MSLVRISHAFASNRPSFSDVIRPTADGDRGSQSPLPLLCFSQSWDHRIQVCHFLKPANLWDARFCCMRLSISSIWLTWAQLMTHLICISKPSPEWMQWHNAIIRPSQVVKRRSAHLWGEWGQSWGDSGLLLLHRPHLLWGVQLCGQHQC